MTIPTLTRGDNVPDLVMTIGDARSDADFSTLTAANVRIRVEQDGILIVDDVVDTYTPAADNKSAVLRRAWVDGETDVVGRCWVSAYAVTWDQTFPDDGPLRLDIARAPGDA